ncbi:hypothetical protein JOB18_046811 [Solea senegalensis]|uniref:Uncharacterized protein n=1 Tax=Solea senegalensis TaxID=28829 RepID=A0AAV6SKJ2_SOLSE|nr:hypothetical protein JOB18_046811 [Solea senegalensis]
MKKNPDPFAQRTGEVDAAIETTLERAIGATGIPSSGHVDVGSSNAGKRTIGVCG